MSYVEARREECYGRDSNHDNSILQLGRVVLGDSAVTIFNQMRVFSRKGENLNRFRKSRVKGGSGFVVEMDY